MIVPPLERFVDKIEFTDSCWLWRAAKDRRGYGHFRPASRQKAMAHRWSYEFFVGPIPAGLQVDHLCHTTNCVNPDHLEPVTNAENARRAATLRTHCINGHPFDAENTITLVPSGRDCRACRREASRRYRASLAH